ncbi:11520_t:CDS:2, partial [Gigaspora margarita]
MLLKNDLTEFTDNVYTELKLKKINLDFRTESVLWLQACNICEYPFLFVTRKACFALRGVYCNTNVNKKLEVYDIKQFLEIVDMLPQDNTVCIHVTSGPFGFSRVAALKCKGLLNNVLFTTIQKIERDIRGYFLMKQDSIKDDMYLIIQKVDKINKKLDSQAK